MYNEISEYRYYFDHNAWSKYTDICDRINTDSCSLDWCEQAYGGQRLNEPYLAVNICTYHRLDEVRRNVNILLESKFFDKNKTQFYGHLHIYVTDNGCELSVCDDVEYGLRCGKTPIILNGIQVWHETYEYRQTPIINYYDTRNPLFVNEKYDLLPKTQIMLDIWKDKITDFHVKKDYESEYYTILGMYDFLKGIKWLEKVDSCKKHKRLQNAKICRYKNSVLWRVTQWKLKRKYGFN